MRVNDLIVFRMDSDGGGVLFNPEDGKCSRLNPVAALIWQALEQGRTQENIIRELTVQFQSPENARQDFDDFCGQLWGAGYLVE